VQHIAAEIAICLWQERPLERNREKPQGIQLPTEKARCLGYAFKAASARLRRRNLRRKGALHNVVQTVKTNAANINLLVPRRALSKKLPKYKAQGETDAAVGSGQAADRAHHGAL
jgi:hypothetical protein